MTELKGWVRENGDVGIRNHIIVLSSVACANHAVLKICDYTGAIPVVHDKGTCGEFGEDRKQTERTLVGIGTHPNVAFTLVIGLGCEELDAHKLADKITAKGRACESLLIQEEGEAETIRKGVEIIKSKTRTLTSPKEKISIEDLIIGVKCGASDYSSYLVSNPAVGKVVDFLVQKGGTAIFGERLEVVGAEHILARRAINEEVRKDFLLRIKRAIEQVTRTGADWIGSQPSMGNIRGGLTTIEEKSLGAIKKTGTCQLMGCVDYAERPKGKGLFFMDTPGFDVQCITGLVAGGCHEVLFTTGLGTYVGSPVAPVIKICANPQTVTKLRDAIDVDLSFVFHDWDLEKAAAKIRDKVIAVAGGELTCAEKSGHREFSIERIGPTA